MGFRLHMSQATVQVGIDTRPRNRLARLAVWIPGPRRGPLGSEGPPTMFQRRSDRGGWVGSPVRRGTPPERALPKQRRELTSVAATPTRASRAARRRRRNEFVKGKVVKIEVAHGPGITERT